MNALPVDELALSTREELIELQGHMTAMEKLSQLPDRRSEQGGRLIPVELINYEEVPVDEPYAESLALQMQQVADRNGEGSGQQAPILLSYIEGEETFRIKDGFHRDAALRLNGEPEIDARIEADTIESLYADRIFAAKDHAHVRFSRVVQWIREVWSFSGLAEDLNVEQAVLLYRYDTSGKKLGLSDETVERAKTWVKTQESLWHMQAMTIHSHLKVAEHVDPRLVHSTREKTSGHVLNAPTQAILKIFATEIPDRFDVQNLVMDVSKQHNLQTPLVRALTDKLKGSTDFATARATVAEIDFNTWNPVIENPSRAVRRGYDPRYKGSIVLNKAADELEKVIRRTTMAIESGEPVTFEMKGHLIDTQRSVGDLSLRLGELAHKLAELIERPIASTLPEAKSKIVPQPQTRPSSVPRSIQPTLKVSEDLRVAPVAPKPTMTRLEPTPTEPKDPQRVERSSSKPTTPQVLTGFEKTVKDFLDGTRVMPAMPTFKQLRAARRLALKVQADPNASPEKLVRAQLLQDEVVYGQNSLK